MNKRWQVKSVADSKVKHGVRGNIRIKRIRNHAKQKSNILAVDDDVINYGLHLLDGNANDDDFGEIEKVDFCKNSDHHQGLQALKSKRHL